MGIQKLWLCFYVCHLQDEIFLIIEVGTPKQRGRFILLIFFCCYSPKKYDLANCDISVYISWLFASVFVNVVVMMSYTICFSITSSHCTKTLCYHQPFTHYSCRLFTHYFSSRLFLVQILSVIYYALDFC